MYCPNCGNELKNNENFCPACGKPVGQEAGNPGQSWQGTGQAAPLYGQSPDGASDRSYPVPSRPDRPYPDRQPSADIPYMPYTKEEPPKKKGKKGLVIALVSLAAAAVVAAAVLILFVFNWERKLEEHVKERDWAEAGALYEEKVSGNDKREEKAGGILREAVDALKEGYDSDSMEYSAVMEHLEAIGEFWDDSYVQMAADEIRSAEGQNAVVGTWNATEVEAMGVNVKVSEYLEQMGLSDMKMEMVIAEDGRFSMDLMGQLAEGTWKYSGSTLTLTVDGEDAKADHEDGRLIIEESGVRIIFEK